jgi:hypothetical protein
MRTCRHQWIGLKFHFPSFWMPHSKYTKGSKVSKSIEAIYWMDMVRCSGFRLANEESHDSYCLSNFH